MILEIPIVGSWFWTRADKKKRPKAFLTDSVDRLHCSLTVLILLGFSLLIESQYFGKPIDCQTPHEVHKAKWTPYVEEYCFVQGTYRYNPGHLATHPYDWGDHVGYYQWVPIFFVFQLLCFLLPYCVWQVVQNCLYIDMKAVISHATAITEDVNKRDAKTEKLAIYVCHYFYYRHISTSGWMTGFWRRRNVISSFYLVFKLLNLCNCVFQFSSVCLLLGAEPFWGVKEAFTLLGSMGFSYVGGPMSLPNATFSYFPKEVRCNYAMAVQDLNNGIVLNYSPTQCLLTINFINEKLFLFLYFWYLTLTTVTAMNIIFYVVGWLSRTSHRKIVDCIIQNEVCSITRLRLLPHARKFTDSFLGAEGVLLLSFVYRNAGAIAAHDLTLKMWELFRKRKGLATDTWSNASDYTSWSFEKPRQGSFTATKMASGDGYDALPNA